MASKPEKKKPAETATQERSSRYQGWVFDIKRFSVHDGPGIRTTVFMKGCSLRCVWCQNPESITPKPEILVHPVRCIDCGTCLTVCPKKAHHLSADGQRVYDRELCELCGRCVEACYAGALATAGRKTSVDEVMTVIREDAEFYRTSGGGVTLSGGEPLLQREFATAILRQCKSEGFHTAVETCGQVKWETIEQVMPHVDLWLYDLKHISQSHHRKYTGSSNQLILENLRRLSNREASIEVHMLIVPSINDSRTDIEAAARYLASLRKISAVRLLTYHRLAGSKYQSLGWENTMPEVASPSTRRLRQIARWIKRFGLEVLVPDEMLRQPQQRSSRSDEMKQEGTELSFHLGDEEKRPW